MPPLGWTKKEAEKRGELGKGRPRAVELRDSVANIAPFEYAHDDCVEAGTREEHGKPTTFFEQVLRQAPSLVDHLPG